MRQIGPQPVETRRSLQRTLIHIERAVDLDLQAVAILGRAPLPADDLDALVALVDAHIITESAQEARDEIGEFRRTSRAVAVAEHEIAMLALEPVAPAAVRRHRMAVDMPDRAEFGVQPRASV